MTNIKIIEKDIRSVMFHGKFDLIYDTIQNVISNVGLVHAELYANYYFHLVVCKRKTILTICPV